jgi:hypothetical protein
MTAVITKNTYTARIIKASGLVGDIKALFAFWDEGRSLEENFQEARRANIFGKASRSRVEDILSEFRQRYYSEPEIASAIRRLVRSSLPADIVDKVLYYHTALADSLIYDFVTEYLFDLHAHGRKVVTYVDSLDFIAQATARGQIDPPWRSPETRARVAQGLLSTLRDFRVLQGAKGSQQKTFAPAYLPVEAFVYVAFDLRRRGISGERILHHPHWRLFFLKPGDIERQLIEAHQFGLLRYAAAGSLVRLEFDQSTPSRRDVVFWATYYLTMMV